MNQKVEVGAFYFNNSRTWFKKIAVVLLSAYVVLSELVRDDPHIKRYGRGKYAYEEFISEDLEKFEKWMVDTIKKAAKFDWVNKSDFEVSKMKKEINWVIHFYHTLSQEFSANKIEV